MNKTIKIAIWNANGLAQRSLEIKSFLIEQNIDVMLISETHFTQKNYLKIPNYIIYNTKHPSGRAQGGTAVIIKDSIKHHESVGNDADYLQATSVTIEDCTGNITLSAIYCPPKHTIKKEMFLKFFNSLGNRFIAGGDYNAKHPWWGSRQSYASPRGKQLYDAMQEQNLIPISTGEPTYWPSDKNKLPDLIDFAVTKGFNANYFSVQSCLDLSSDHSPILIQLNTQIINTEKRNLLYNKKTNWQKYREYIEENLSCGIPLKSAKDLEKSIEIFNKVLHSAAMEATLQIEPKNRVLNIPTYIKMKLQNKRRLRRIWQITRSKLDKTKLNQATKDLKEALHIERNNEIANYLEKLTPTEATEYSLWKATKKIKQPQQFIPPIRTQNGTWARNDEEKADVFAKHLSKVFEPPARQITEKEEYELLETQLIVSESEVEEHLSIKSVKVGELNNIIKNLRIKKSPGYDDIDGKLIKELPVKAIRFLTILMNAAFRLQHFPDQWKVAQIILIH